MAVIRLAAALALLVAEAACQPAPLPPPGRAPPAPVSPPSLATSAGGEANCQTGLMAVSVSALGVEITVPEPANQTVVTEYIQELTQSNPTITNSAIGGQQTISGTYNIDYTLCYPSDPAKLAQVQTLQILTHGIGLDKSYWDIGAGYSHVDAAVSAGYATLAYNRLGVGASDHPDALQVVQASVDVEIQHGMTQLMRQNGAAAMAFKNIVATGHSYGSIVVLAQAAKYPSDVDAIVLTGFVNQVEYLPQTVLANNPAIAAQNNPSKWGQLSTGYLVHDTSISYQLPFWRWPYFDPNIFNQQLNNKDTYTLGQQFTLPMIYSAAPDFTGPVDVVVGQHDYPFCHGDCNYPSDLAASTREELFTGSNANASQSYIVPNSGHIINGHYEAQSAFSQINSFLQSNSM